ncbi:MAG: response regulator transcription factor [Coriobacteriales bacterium]|jgi:DNA-binding response OmpR family regulator|nr:response regulator transcription factor [Coriobacteriales bacterium]
MRILLVEDEKLLARALAEILRRNNYAVDLAYDGEEGLYLALSGVHDIIVLDIMLPLRDGLSVLGELRASGCTTPVLLLTALGQTTDKVRGLDAGADDYLSKPFHSQELLARLRALGRRREELPHAGRIVRGDISFDPHALVVECGERRCILTRKESQLLEMLVANANAVVPKSRIREKLWGFETTATPNRVEIQVSLLRKKLASLGSAVSVRTVRGMGYLLDMGTAGACCEGAGREAAGVGREAADGQGAGGADV